MNKKFFNRSISLILVLFLCMGMVPLLPAESANYNMEYFLKKYNDPRFNLANDPDRAMTVEEFVAIIYAYSYYGDGVAPYSVPDKNGREPSSWCARYVCAEVSKKVIDPEKISWTEPVTVAFAAQYLARAKGKYSYDSNNLYSFTGTKNLSADDILYLKGGCIMSRGSREYSELGIYHIMFRGVNKQNIFEEDFDFKVMSDYIKELKKKFSFEIYAYCFMTNHVHLVL